MHFTLKDFKRYLFFVLIFLWVLVFSHLFYIYLKNLWVEKAVKGWVIIEWIVKNDNVQIVNPIPYFSNNYYSKYLQSILFKWCLNSKWEEDLCNITTKDNKVFDITLKWDYYWSDGRKLTLDDIYFTYNDIILKNSLQLKNVIPNSIKTIEKNENSIKVTFNEASINNLSFFKNYILPKHIFKNINKDNIAKYLDNFVNITCSKIDPKSDFINNIIFDYSKCKDYYINKYQFVILNNENELSNLLTWKNKVDLYDAYENVNKNSFKRFDIRLSKRYAIFWNVKRKWQNDIKVFLSNAILSWLKENLDLRNKLYFNWYWLFVLPDTDLSWNLSSILFNEEVQKQKKKYEAGFRKVNWNILKYKQWENNKFFVKNIKNTLLFNITLLKNDYDKVSISSNKRPEYFPKSYEKWKNTFQYGISEKFKNVLEWKNIYTVYWYYGEEKTKLFDIILYYKKLDYPKFNVKYKPIKIVYLNKWVVKNIWDVVTNVISKIYPWNVEWNALDKSKYKKILQDEDYDIAIAWVNFEWKDISPIFKTKDPLSNPSLFANPSFASLIKQDLIAPNDKLREKVFKELNKIYQENIPVVFIWNEKKYLFINKKYNPKDLDYTYFENRKKFIKSTILKKIKQASLKQASLSWFINFLRKNINAK